MQYSSVIIVLLLLIQSLVFGQKSPHGENFDINCSNCHTTESWKVDVNKMKFDHGTTNFKLVGQHKDVNCASCHKSLKFTNTPTNCVDCHTDIHQNSVGFDCANCHNPKSWLVSNILEIHEENRFPLTGAHQTLDCQQCHITASLLNFKPLGVDCYQCHKQQYSSTQTPNHIQAGFSKNCEKCHYLTSDSWGASGFIHDFFPLTGGHAISDCSVCHKPATFKGVSTDCVTCHRTNYENTSNPNHLTTGFGTDCATCHSIDAWIPSDFPEHDGLYFPIYSGDHKGEWGACSDCHINQNDYSVYSCLKCHDSNNGGDSAKLKFKLRRR